MTATTPYVCTLNKKLQEKAKKELNEKPERRGKDIEALRDMVNAHPGLKCPTDDVFLLKFLRARKFNLDRAYALILNYYTVRAENPEVFAELVPSKNEDTMGEKIMMNLPNRDKEGRAIIFHRPGRWNVDAVSDKALARLLVLQLEVALMDEETQVSGIILVVDFTGLTMKHATTMEKGNNKLFPTIMQDAFPLRMKALHMCKQPSIFSIAWAVISPFFKEKLKKRVNFYGDNLKKLHNEVGVENLPEEVGGTLGSADNISEVSYAKIRAAEKKFEDDLNYKIELTKPITKMKNDEVVDALMGTYKKLSVD